MLKDNRVISIIKLSRQAYKNYTLQIVVLTVFGMIGGLLEGIGVNALIPLFSFITGDGKGGSDIISVWIGKLFASVNLGLSVKYLLIFITVLFILKAFVAVWLNYIRIKITADYEERTRNKLFESILASRWMHLINQKSGYLETIMLVDAPASSKLLSQIGQTITVVTSLIMYILVAINISFTVTLVTLILGGIIFLIFKPLLYRIKIWAYERTSVNKEVAHHVNENVTGMKTIKTMVADRGVLLKAGEYFRKLKSLIIKSSVVKNITSSFIQPIGIIVIVVLFAFSYKSSVFSLAALAAIVYLIQRIFIYVQQFQRSLHTLNDLLPHLRSVLHYEEKAFTNAETDSGTKKFNLENELAFRSVDFSYNNEEPVLSRIQFIIPKGEIVGVVGPSGVGKTTLVDLLLRLLEPTNGTIEVDGTLSTEIDLKDWRRNIGYVSQDIFLMNDTIANNIRFYNKSITQKEIERVAKMANIHSFVSRLPHKFNTLVGDRGVRLSVGQRQRIVLARVLATNPQLLVLDEATSALDNESEAAIQKVIQQLKGTVTVVMIAHRLQTVMDADKLIVLEKGKIVESGTPRRLMNDKHSYFYKMYHVRK